MPEWAQAAGRSICGGALAALAMLPAAAAAADVIVAPPLSLEQRAVAMNWDAGADADADAPVVSPALAYDVAWIPVSGELLTLALATASASSVALLAAQSWLRGAGNGGTGVGVGDEDDEALRQRALARHAAYLRHTPHADDQESPPTTDPLDSLLYLDVAADATPGDDGTVPVMPVLMTTTLVTPTPPALVLSQPAPMPEMTMAPPRETPAFPTFPAAVSAVGAASVLVYTARTHDSPPPRPTPPTPPPDFDFMAATAAEADAFSAAAAATAESLTSTATPREMWARPGPLSAPPVESPPLWGPAAVIGEAASWVMSWAAWMVQVAVVLLRLLLRGCLFLVQLPFEGVVRLILPFVELGAHLAKLMLSEWPVTRHQQDDDGVTGADRGGKTRPAEPVLP